MRVSAGTLKIIQLLLGLIIMAGAAGAGWWLLSFNTDTTETETRAQLTRLEASANVYYGRLQYFDGVCNDIGVPSSYSCHDENEAYAIEAPLGGGHYICLDSQGFFSQTVISKGTDTSCRRY